MAPYAAQTASQPVALPGPQRQSLESGGDRGVPETIWLRYATQLRMTPKPTCVLFSSPVGHVGSVVVPNIRCISETKSGDILVQKFRAAILIVDRGGGV